MSSSNMRSALGRNWQWTLLLPMTAVSLTSTTIAAKDLGPDGHELDPYDSAELHAIQRDTPSAIELLKSSEEHYRAGRLTESARALREARHIAPNRAILDRRYCDRVTDLGQREEALDACRRALSRKTGPQELRMMVRALLRSGHAPTSDQLAEALWMIGSLRRVHGGSVHRYAAESDLAATLGDWNAQTEYLERMKLIDASHPELARAQSLFESRRVGWHVAIGWVLLIAAVLGTLGHASLKALSRTRRELLLRPPLVAVVLGIAIQFVPHTAAARDTDQFDASGKFAINHDNPESSVPSDEEKNRAPLDFGYFVMGLSDRAEAATKRSDHKVAARYYRALVKAVPDKAIGFSKLCQSYVADQDLENAVASCRAALTLDGVRLEDYRRFVDVLLARKAKLTDAELKEIDEVSAHLRRQLPDGIAAAQLDCKLGLRQQDTSRMQRCTKHLEIAVPSDPQTITYQWAHALMRGDQKAARRYIGTAKVAEMAPEAIESMELATERSVTMLQRLSKHAWLLATFGLVGMFALSVLIAARRRLRLTGDTFPT